MDEQVGAGEVGGEVSAGAEACEARPRHQPAQRLPLRPLPHDQQPDAGHVVDDLEILDLLLRRQTTHIDHELLVRPRVGGPQHRAAQLRGEQSGVHAAPPEVHPLDAVVEQLIAGRRRGGEVHGRPVVDVAQQLPGGVLQERHPVPGGVAGDVGLVDRDGGHSCLLGGDHGSATEDHRGGEVENIGLELVDPPLQRRGAGGGDPDLGVAGHRSGGDATHPHPSAAGGAQVLVRSRPLGGDDPEIITRGGEMVHDAEHRVRDPVHVR